MGRRRRSDAEKADARPEIGWIDLKAALVSRNAHAVLAACERDEDSAVGEYQKAIESGNLPSHVLDTVQAQAVDVKANHDKIRGLRDSIPA